MNPDKNIEDMFKSGDIEVYHLGAFEEIKLIGIFIFSEETSNIWRISGKMIKKENQRHVIGSLK